MPLDPSIYAQIQQPQQVNPLAQLAQASQIQGAQQQNRLAALQMQEYERARTEADAQRQAIIQAGNDPKAIGQAYLSQGNAKGYLDYQKGQADLGKTAAETQAKQIEAATKRVDLAGQAFGFVRANPTVENAHSTIDYLVQNNVWDAATGAQYKAQVAANPGSIAQLADQAYRSALSAKDQLANYQTRNTGGTTDTIAIDPVTGKTRVTNSVQNTQSPDSVASTAVQIRGQNMTDARSRENSAIARQASMAGRIPSGYRDKGDGTLEFIPGGPADPSKPSPGGGTEGERKAATLLQRLEGSSAQLEKALQEDPKAAKPGAIGSALRSGGLEVAANQLTGSARQRVEAAQLDMLDAALTLGTGAAYTEAQLKGYQKSYFPQLGDTADNIKDKQVRLANVIGAARIAAGAAAGKVNPVTSVRSPAVGNGWSIQEVK